MVPRKNVLLDPVYLSKSYNDFQVIGLKSEEIDCQKSKFEESILKDVEEPEKKGTNRGI